MHCTSLCRVAAAPASTTVPGAPRKCRRKNRARAPRPSPALPATRAAPLGASCSPTSAAPSSCCMGAGVLRLRFRRVLLVEQLELSSFALALPMTFAKLVDAQGTTRSNRLIWGRVQRPHCGRLLRAGPTPGCRRTLRVPGAATTRRGPPEWPGILPGAYGVRLAQRDCSATLARVAHYSTCARTACFWPCARSPRSPAA